LIAGTKGFSLFSILNEVCFTNGTDKSLASKYLNNLTSNKHFKQARKASDQFIVHHYAGPVEYDP